MAHLEELPLFPLHSVLFPYSSLHLNVFEDRYRQMIRTCLEFDQPFGIVLIRSGQEVGDLAEPFLIGTAVRIASMEELPDGRLDVHVEGERRFRVRRLDESQPYLIGHVEPVGEVEVENPVRTEALMARATELFQDLIQMEIGRRDFNVEIRASRDPSVLSFVIAGFLPMENLDKQRLLELTDPDERLSILIGVMEKSLADSIQPKLLRVGIEHFRDWVCDN
ncbi:MAG: LON peptidase substrate-binding domain-containing protein [Chthonomonas sp.]|nr:LON peptidase substrate-binding domain-containing protein [Chthonomonas sp.]